MNSWLNQGRLRRPGRGLKSKRIRQQTIQKTASHTEFLTLPSDLLLHGSSRPSRSRLSDTKALTQARRKPPLCVRGNCMAL